eukprot:COSAG01_NODE_2582_length_7421_cov_4.252253_7_plen_110_part_00
MTPLAGKLSRGRSEGELVLAIEHAGSGVAELRSSLGFEALSAAGHWVSCPATARTASTVTVSGVPEGATKLRYNWYRLRHRIIRTGILNWLRFPGGESLPLGNRGNPGF